MSDKLNNENLLSVTDENKAEQSAPAKPHFPVKDGEEFDIADFIVKHNTVYTVKKKRIWTKILGIVMAAIMIVVICMLGAFLIMKSGNQLYGTWVSGSQVMVIEKDKITIGNNSNEYNLEENNIIALKIVNGENTDYFRMIYKLDGDKLTIIIPAADDVQKIEYTRK